MNTIYVFSYSKQKMYKEVITTEEMREMMKNPNLNRI